MICQVSFFPLKSFKLGFYCLFVVSFCLVIIIVILILKKYHFCGRIVLVLNLKKLTNQLKKSLRLSRHFWREFTYSVLLNFSPAQHWPHTHQVSSQGHGHVVLRAQQRGQDYLQGGRFKS